MGNSGTKKGQESRPQPARRARGDAPSGALDTLVNRLKLLILVRVVSVTLLSASTLFFELQQSRSVLAGSSDRFLYFLTTGVYILSLGYTLTLRLVPRLSWQRLHAHVQVALDIVFVALLTLVTRLTDSVFAFLFSVVIVMASIMLPRPGSLLAAIFATALFLLIGLAQLNLASFELFLEGLGAPEEFLVKKSLLTTLSTEGGIFYNLVANILAFFSIGLLATYLSEKLRRTGQALDEQRLSLAALKALHENVTASLPVAVVTTDRDLRVTFANPEATSLYGFARRQMVGRPITFFFPDLSAILANEDKLTMKLSETTVQILGGRQVHLRWTIAPLLAADGTVVGRLLIFQDVTRLMRMEAEAKRKDRLVTIGKLAAGIAHEIRNPLASISGSIQLLRDTMNPEEEDRRLMDIVVRETDSLNDRITEFLAYARPCRLDPREMELIDIVTETMEVFRHDPRATGRTVRIASPWPPRTSAEVDREGLKKVLWDLLYNAADATDEGDTIEVGLANATRGGKDYIVLWVRDTGCGISSEDRARVTEPFFTTREGGTGLGLSLVERLVEEHGGGLNIESEEGTGTKMSVFFPFESSVSGDLVAEAELGADAGGVGIDSSANLPLPWTP